MSCTQCLEKFVENPSGICFGQSALRPQPIGDGTTVRVLHGNEVGTGLNADLIERNDVGMIEPTDGLSLLAKTVQIGWVAGQLSGQYLDGNIVAQ